MQIANAVGQVLTQHRRLLAHTTLGPGCQLLHSICVRASFVRGSFGEEVEAPDQNTAKPQRFLWHIAPSSWLDDAGTLPTWAPNDTGAYTVVFVTPGNPELCGEVSSFCEGLPLLIALREAG
jgi:hypothetical protein